CCRDRRLDRARLSISAPERPRKLPCQTTDAKFRRYSSSGTSRRTIVAAEASSLQTRYVRSTHPSAFHLLRQYFGIEAFENIIDIVDLAPKDREHAAMRGVPLEEDGPAVIGFILQ